MFSPRATAKGLYAVLTTQSLQSFLDLVLQIASVSINVTVPPTEVFLSVSVEPLLAPFHAQDQTLSSASNTMNTFGQSTLLRWPSCASSVLLAPSECLRDVGTASGHINERLPTSGLSLGSDQDNQPSSVTGPNPPSLSFNTYGSALTHLVIMSLPCLCS